MTTNTTRYLSCAETAKLVRQALKKAFPGVKFSVRSNTYAGGASIYVTWTDGPSEADVRPVTDDYHGKGFDGGIDMAYSRTHYLRADGTTLVEFDPGTTASGGQHYGDDNRALAGAMPEDVEVVQFGADGISLRRELSDKAGALAEAEAWIRENCGVDRGRTPSDDRFGNVWVSDIAARLAYDRVDGESWTAVFARRYGD